MAPRSPVLFAVCALLVATATASSSSSTCPAASASTFPSSASTTCPAPHYGQPPAAGMAGPRVSSSAEETMEEDDDEERLLREAEAGPQVSSSAEGTMEDEDERWERLLRMADTWLAPEGTMEGDQEEESEELRLARELERLMRVGNAVDDLVGRLYHMTNVLDFFGFHELAAGAPDLAGSPVLASWQGPWTVFAVPDEAVQACIGCPAVGLLHDHIALGAFTYSQLSAKAMKKVAKPSVGSCFTASTSSSAGGASKATVSLDGVKMSHPDLYNDGRLVVHGMEGLVLVPEEGSCFSTTRLSKAELIKILLRVFAFRPEEPLDL